MSVSYKVIFIAENQESEMRRFTSEGIGNNFSSLNEKLSSVFPSLKTYNFTLQWTDDEGDEVRITGDEDLATALTEMKGPAYKFIIKTTGKKKEEEKKSTLLESIHTGIICDGCDKPVAGFRYKCLTCSDYDLCGSCEMQGMHPMHIMIRIAKPEKLMCGPRLERCSKGSCKPVCPDDVSGEDQTQKRNEAKQIKTCPT